MFYVFSALSSWDQISLLPFVLGSVFNSKSTGRPWSYLEMVQELVVTKVLADYDVPEAKWGHSCISERSPMSDAIQRLSTNKQPWFWKRGGYIGDMDKNKKGRKPVWIGLKRTWYASKWSQVFNEVLLEKGAEKWLEENMGSRKVAFF